MSVFHEYWAHHINYNGRSIIFQLVHFIRYNGAISSSMPNLIKLIQIYEVLKQVYTIVYRIYTSFLNVRDGQE